MSGRSKGHVRTDGTATRVKIELLPELLYRLPAKKRVVWNLVGSALCSRAVKEAFVRRLARPLQPRFSNNYTANGLYPIPILTRDIAGYQIQPHTDTLWKGITVQFYLPDNNDHTDIGTIFHSVNADGTLLKHSKMKFARNNGYAFAVGADTWHSADPVDEGVKTRDSILLTYFVDNSVVTFLKNRGKRLGNLCRNEFAQLVRR